jgi:energy-coupling factor transporter ATP-binding protein EcfA2
MDLDIRKGEYLLVCGASGSGKSTLGYLFNGLIPHFFGGTLEGSVHVAGVNTLDSRPADLFATVGMVVQNTDAHLFNVTVEDEIAFGLESIGLPPPRIADRLRQVAREFHLEPLLGRSPMALSGGERRLAAIASVICVEPSVLVLDEPHANLDWEGVRLLRDALRQIHKGGKSVVVIEQILGVFTEDITRCVLLQEGKVRLDSPSEDAVPLLLEEHLIPRYAPRSRRPPETEVILEVDRLAHERGGAAVLKDVSFRIRKGETIALVGRNGSGKTTLIKHFNGLLRPTAGEVRFKGLPVRASAPSQMARSIGLCFQNANDQLFKSTVKEELMAGPLAAGKSPGPWFEETCRILDLHRLWERSPHRLSEGEKKRVALGSILVMKPDLLVLDEPTVGQDGRFRETLAALIHDLQGRGYTTLLATHDLDFARATADRWIVLRNGQTVADGLPDEVMGEVFLESKPGDSMADGRGHVHAIP